MKTTNSNTISRSQWATAVSDLGLVHRTWQTWTEIPAILKVLKPFIGDRVNCADLPSGGCMHFLYAALAPEPECLAFQSGPHSSTTPSRRR
jgi:hypothetical protein